MAKTKHFQHRIGHLLFIIGAFIALLGLSILSPMNRAISRAFGASEIIELSNQARTDSNRQALNTNTDLTRAAQMKADDMAQKHYFAHIAPDGSEAWDYFEQVSYDYAYAGENLAITNEDATAVINGWLSSPTHRENLLNSNYLDFGIGIAEFGEYNGHSNTVVVVAFYGHPPIFPDTMAVTVQPAAGTTSLDTGATLKPSFLTISPTAIIAIASTLMLLGLVLELRHLKHLHKFPHFTKG